jgi:hypothetical protein
MYRETAGFSAFLQEEPKSFRIWHGICICFLPVKGSPEVALHHGLHAGRPRRRLLAGKDWFDARRWAFFDGFVPVFRKERSMVTVAVALTSELVLPSPDQRPSQR